MGRFPALLKALEHATATGGPVDRALVIRDANGGNVAAIEAAMMQRLGTRTFAFPCGLRTHVVLCETETWLMADHDAISRVAIARGGRAVPQVPGNLESFHDAKERLQRVLIAAGLPRLPDVYAEISRETDLIRLRQRCPGFVLFEQKVTSP